ncbi:MAG: YibE/F family protein [Eubacteriales bacterium]|nr:YibE/F family protein [Eubacteriales bacterium]
MEDKKNILGLNKLKNKKITLRITSFIIAIFFLALIVIGNITLADGDYYFTAENNLTSQKAEVVKILDYGYEDSEALLLSCKLLNGKDKGKIIVAKQYTDSFLGESVRHASQGDKIYLGDTTTPEGDTEWFLYEYERFNGIIWLALVFALLLLIFGKHKGLTTILSIMYTIMTIFLVFLPAVLSGHNIYACAVSLCIFISVMCLLLIQGPTPKCFAASLGCFGGLFVISTITVFMSNILKITGVMSEESLFLLQMNNGHPIDLKAIVFASITIGAMGAVLDIAVDIVASLSELYRHNPDMSLSNTMKSGIIIGRDIVGSMSNTLILAYIGSSLSLMLLILVNTGSVAELLNSELIVVEILQALAGSIGILFTIPLTTLSYALIFRHLRNKSRPTRSA